MAPFEMSIWSNLIPRRQTDLKSSNVRKMKSVRLHTSNSDPLWFLSEPKIDTVKPLLMYAGIINFLPFLLQELLEGGHY